jgi:hypothetical protein
VTERTKLQLVFKTYAGWRKSPPTHRLKAAELGFKPPNDATPTQVSSEAEIDAFMAEINEGSRGRQ